jgi:aminoglycoside 6-adenylyltransferase
LDKSISTTASFINTNHSVKRLDDIAGRFVKWGEENKVIRGIFAWGSYVREDRPADAYSDLDLMIFTKKPEKFIKNEQWLRK